MANLKFILQASEHSNDHNIRKIWYIPSLTTSVEKSKWKSFDVSSYSVGTTVEIPNTSSYGYYYVRVECEPYTTNDDVYPFQIAPGTVRTIKKSCQGHTIRIFFDRSYTNVYARTKATPTSSETLLWLGSQSKPNAFRFSDWGGYFWFPIKSNSDGGSCIRFTAAALPSSLSDKYYPYLPSDMNVEGPLALEYSSRFSLDSATYEYYCDLNIHHYISVKVQPGSANIKRIKLLDNLGNVLADTTSSTIYRSGLNMLDVAIPEETAKSHSYGLTVRAYVADGYEFYTEKNAKSAYIDMNSATIDMAWNVTLSDYGVPVKRLSLTTKEYSIGTASSINHIKRATFEYTDRDHQNWTGIYEYARSGASDINITSFRFIGGYDKDLGTTTDVGLRIKDDIEIDDNYRILRDITENIPLTSTSLTLYTKATSGYKVLSKDNKIKYIEEIFARDIPNATEYVAPIKGDVKKEIMSSNSNAKFKHSPNFKDTFLDFSDMNEAVYTTGHWYAWGHNESSGSPETESLGYRYADSSWDQRPIGFFRPYENMDRSFQKLKFGTTRNTWNASTLSSYVSNVPSGAAFDPNIVNKSARNLWLLGTSALMPFNTSNSQFGNVIFNQTMANESDSTLEVNVRWDARTRKTVVETSNGGGRVETDDSDGVFLTIVAAGGAGGMGGFGYGSNYSYNGGGGGGSGASATIYIDAKKHYERYGTENACKILLGGRGQTDSYINDNGSSILTSNKHDGEPTYIKVLGGNDYVNWTLALGGGRGGGFNKVWDGGDGGIVKFKDGDGEFTTMDATVVQTGSKLVFGERIDSRTTSPRYEVAVPNTIKDYFRLVCVSNGRAGGEGGNYHIYEPSNPDLTYDGKAALHRTHSDPEFNNDEYMFMLRYKNSYNDSSYSTYNDTHFEKLSGSWVDSDELYPFDLSEMQKPHALSFRDNGNEIYMGTGNETNVECAHINEGYQSKTKRTQNPALFLGGCGAPSTIGCGIRVTINTSSLDKWACLSGRTCGFGCGGRGGSKGPYNMVYWSSGYPSGGGSGFENQILPDPGSPAGIWVYETTGITSD